MRNLNLSGWNFGDDSDHVNFMWMFLRNKNLEHLDLSNWRLPPEAFYSEFCTDTSVKTIDLTGWNIQHFEVDNGNACGGMFAQNAELTTIYCENSWYHVQVQSNMFRDDEKLVGGNGTTAIGHNYNPKDGDNELGYCRPDLPGQMGFFTMPGSGNSGNSTGDSTGSIGDSTNGTGSANATNGAAARPAAPGRTSCSPNPISPIQTTAWIW